MVKKGLLWVALAGPLAAGGQWSEPYTLGAYSRRFVDVLSQRSNTAALAGIGCWQAAVQVVQPYGLRELAQYIMVSAIPLPGGVLGLTAARAGTAAASHSLLGIGLGKMLGRVDLGLQVQYQGWRAAGYGTDGVVSAELGTVWRLSDRLQAGLQLRNPVPLRWWRRRSELLPWRYAAGLGYELSPLLLLGVELVKTAGSPADWHAGLQYSFSQTLFAAAGIRTANGIPYAGFGWQWNGFRLLVNGSYHFSLGLSPALSLIVHPVKHSE